MEHLGRRIDRDLVGTLAVLRDAERDERLVEFFALLFGQGGDVVGPDKAVELSLPELGDRTRDVDGLRGVSRVDRVEQRVVRARRAFGPDDAFNERIDQPASLGAFRCIGEEPFDQDGPVVPPVELDRVADDRLDLSLAAFAFGVIRTAHDRVGRSGLPWRLLTLDDRRDFVADATGAVDLLLLVVVKLFGAGPNLVVPHHAAHDARRREQQDQETEHHDQNM